MDNTICAISTALGVGAISIIRCSGPNSIRIVNSIFKGNNLLKVKTHTINYGYIYYENEVVDEVLVSVMRAPKTFTKEDIVEINSHGGPTTTNKILEILLSSGCILATPGEFTKRAFLNGRIDLIEAEAVSDLITSESENARKIAINQITGNLSNIIKIIRKKIITLQADIEVNIDYPEYEEAKEYTKDTIIPKITEINNDLLELISNSKNSEIAKNGINVAIIGKPNVGKSSILNKFLSKDKAIVTSIPGTTRDVVEGRITFNGINMNLLDTAGLRKTGDVIEQIGVKKSFDLAKSADLIIYVVDNSKEIDLADIAFLNDHKNSNIIIFANKNDLNPQKRKSVEGYNIIYGNTIDDKGLNNLKSKISEMFKLNIFDTNNYSFLSNTRQVSLVKKTQKIYQKMLSEIANEVPIDMLTIDLRESYELLGELIGETYKDDLLDELFSKFCLGK